MKLDLPVMLIVLALTAVAQNLLPGLPGSPLKIPFLSGVAVYYALNRPQVMALVAALWAGWLTDSAGGLPGLCTTSFLFLLALLLRPMRHILLNGCFIGVSMTTSGVALALALWQLAWARLVLPGSAWRVAGDLVLLLPSGAIAGATAYSLACTLDRFAGNVKEKAEG